MSNKQDRKMTVSQLVEELNKLIEDGKGHLKVQIGCMYDSNYGYTSSNQIEVSISDSSKYVEIKGMNSDKYYED